MRKLLVEQVRDKWNSVKILDNIVDIRPGENVVIIGTLYKDMTLKPSILTPMSLTGILGRKFEKSFKDSDKMIIEDNTGRLKIQPNDVVSPNKFVTGTVIALLGTVNINGVFSAEGFTYAGCPVIDSMPDGVTIPPQSDDDCSLGMFDNLEGRQFVAIVSGLEFGNSKEKATTELLLRTFMGQIGSTKEKSLMSKVCRVVIGGNNIADLTESIN